jgi:hypothetical protein
MKISNLAMAVLAAASLGGAARAADLAGARAFVSRLYAHYPTSGRGQGFDSMGAEMGRIFHPSLIALIKEDQRLAGGEVPALDGDPLCDCQDDAAMTFTIQSARAAGPARAVVAVVRRAEDEPRVETLSLDLALAGGHWRIWDVRSQETPSLRAFLIENNQERLKAR